MKKLISFVFIAAIIIACGSTDDKKSSKSTSTASAKAENKPDGEKIYKTYCVTCHGVRGDMGASGAFNLTTSVLTLEERIEVITNGRNTMTPFKSLLDEEKIKAVAEFTMTLKKE